MVGKLLPGFAFLMNSEPLIVSHGYGKKEGAANYGYLGNTRHHLDSSICLGLSSNSVWEFGSAFGTIACFSHTNPLLDEA